MKRYTLYVLCAITILANNCAATDLAYGPSGALAGLSKGVSGIIKKYSQSQEITNFIQSYLPLDLPELSNEQAFVALAATAVSVAGTLAARTAWQKAKTGIAKDQEFIDTLNDMLAVAKQKKPISKSLEKLFYRLADEYEELIPNGEALFISFKSAIDQKEIATSTGLRNTLIVFLFANRLMNKFNKELLKRIFFKGSEKTTIIAP